VVRDPLALPTDVGVVLRGLGLAPSGASSRFFGSLLGGGVSASVWFVRTSTGPVCVKRPLQQLRVASEWSAPLDRVTFEAMWLQLAGGIQSDAAPTVIGIDHAAHVLVMEWLDPDQHPVWKNALLTGNVDATTAGTLGARLGAMHRHMRCELDDPARLAAWAPATALFEALRIEPYLITTAERSPLVRAELLALAAGLRASATTIIHGDVSPKNVLVGPAGPILLDAECACIGDPSFDVAFLLNHLLMKSTHLPESEAHLRTAAEQFWRAYQSSADARGASDADVARLLPALALARVDGRSPLEYLTEDQRVTVRAAATDLVLRPRRSIEDTWTTWMSHART
jgi:tRNA A-37 threonylcarbamoyl transferase component Bud32